MRLFLAALITPLSVRLTFYLLRFILALVPDRGKNRSSSCVGSGYPLLACSVDGFFQSSQRTISLFRWIYWASFLLCYLLRSFMPWTLLPGLILIAVLCFSKLRLFLTSLLVAVKNIQEFGAPPVFPLLSSLLLLIGNCYALYVLLSTIPRMLFIS